MRHLFTLQLVILLFLINDLNAQLNYKFPEPIVELTIKPSDTDVTIKEYNSPHLVVYDPTIKQGKLLLFLAGTNGMAVKGPKDLFLTAIEQGYHVINLQYITRPAVAQICRGETLVKNSNCAADFRTRRIYGSNKFDLINDTSQDAIVNRLTKLLIYLSKNDKNTNWNAYLKDGKINWEKIAVSGQSQGGGMAAFIAKRELVARVIDFSGGWDYSAKNKIASWYFNKSVTPSNLWYGTYHVTEPKAKTIHKSYEAMNIPKDHIYPFNLEVPAGKKGHSNGIRNLGYKKQWIELLGKGN
ncbi:hypothetical protein EGM88_01635 [Aureibaculum marinum]|uniref:Alpha/beta hydrolase n=1 Tax=Aureibaculum marinum TaxID=2487930 RepID=A0A3N4P5S0_9FLAO|nr:hypothetical protein [Aureibaculum marinum]RPD99990.1 hypothetical protein EGM88_01635 [Aureibaculum marinum]